MSDDKKQELKIQGWIKHEDRHLSNKWYAIGRIDLLIISISGGGIYIAFELLKFVKEHNMILNISSLKWAGVFFTFAIISNFISQFFGFYANDNESLYANQQIKIQSGEKVDDGILAKLDFKGTLFNRAVRTSNFISVVSMTVGIILLSVFSFNL